MRCGHAGGTDEQYVKAAIMAGFQELGFSEHIAYPPIDKPTERMLLQDIDTYLMAIEALKETYADTINIKVGFEIEYYEDQLPYLQDMRKRCDYMILGQHCQFVDGCGYDYLSDDEAVKTYTKQVLAGMKSGLISMVAHPDYFMLGRRDFSEVCRQATRDICEGAIAFDIPLEINLNGMRYGTYPYQEGDRYPYPYRDFWEIASTYPIKVVYGFDAHHPTTLLEASRITKAEHILEGLSFSFMDTFVIK